MTNQEVEYLKVRIVEALKFYDGEASLIEVAKFLWDNYEHELRERGDLFYRWQYVMRWSATSLRKAGIIRSSEVSKRGVWELKYH